MTDQVDETPMASPTHLRDVLMQIRAKRGTLTPEIVVDEASDPTHPLHHRFTWDDSEAARKWRLHEAGNLLRVRYKADAGDDRADLRAFWVRRDETGAPTSTYEPLEEIVQDPFQRELMLRQMRRDWQSFKKRYQHMEEFVTDIISDLEPQAG